MNVHDARSLGSEGCERCAQGIDLCAGIEWQCKHSAASINGYPRSCCARQGRLVIPVWGSSSEMHFCDMQLAFYWTETPIHKDQ
jgi:hypothetical protein